MKWLVAGIVLYVLLGAGLLTFVSRSMRKALREQQQRVAQRQYPAHVGPVAKPGELKGSGRIYLLQMGPHKDPYSAEEFALWLHTKYALDVRVLAPTPIDASAWNAKRKQFAAEMVYEQMKRDHPDLALDPDAYLIGFTDADLYTEHMGWRGTFTQRDMRRAAIISSDGMQDSPLLVSATTAGQNRADAANAAGAHFAARMRRILLKDVAALYWHVPLNEDPTSLMHDTLDPNLPTEDIYESDLDPARSTRGEIVSEPCIFFDYSAKRGLRLRPGPDIRHCSDDTYPDDDTAQESFELDLRLGLLLDERTDFFLPDTIPIQFQRVTRDGWKGINPFGISGSDNYDEYLSSADNVTIAMRRADGGQRQFLREPRWLSSLSLVKYVDQQETGYYEMRWRAAPYEHYDVTRFDGAVLAFLPCNGATVWCYLTDYHDFDGRELKFERGERRRLERLVSPNQSWLKVEYDPTGRIGTVTDSRGRVVRYGYDGANQLTSVTYPNGEVCRYEYDSTQHLLTFSAAPDSKTPPRVLMRNEYAHGLLVKTTLADGSVYQYQYTPEDARGIQAAEVQMADGKVFRLKVREWFSVVHEQ